MRSRLLLLPLLVLVAAQARGTTPVPPPTVAALAGTWLGGPQFSGEYARLELDENGRGMLIVQYGPHESPVAYEIVETHLTHYAVEFRVRTVDRGPEYNIYLRGDRAYPELLELEMGSSKFDPVALGPWKRQLVMQREAKVRARIEAVSQTAERYRSKIQSSKSH